MIAYIFLLSPLIIETLAFDWRQEVDLFWSAGCDWPNNDLTNALTTGEQCGQKCAKYVGCTHFTWTRYQGGTCWLKKNRVSQNDATYTNEQDAACGYLKNQEDPGPGPTGCSDGWEIKKQFGFSSIEQIRQDWDIVTPEQSVNDEKQRYTADDRNIFARDGHLVLKAFKDGDNSYTSGRVESKETYTPFDAPGKKLRVEYTGKVPTISGAWPAYWMLGIEGTYGGGWPNEGEIDVMEWAKNVSGTYLGTLHWKGSDTGTDRLISREFGLSADEMASNYITYGVEWSAVPNDEYVQYYMRRGNGELVNSRKFDRNTWSNFNCGGRLLGQFPCSFLAPFDNRMHLIINLAVGGNFGDPGIGNQGDYNAFWGGIEFETSEVTVCQKL